MASPACGMALENTCRLRLRKLLARLSSGDLGGWLGVSAGAPHTPAVDIFWAPITYQLLMGSGNTLVARTSSLRPPVAQSQVKETTN